MVSFYRFFTRALLPSDFERVQPYACHIKYLNLEQDYKVHQIRLFILAKTRGRPGGWSHCLVTSYQTCWNWLLCITENQHNSLENVHLFIRRKLITFSPQFSAISHDESIGLNTGAGKPVVLPKWVTWVWVQFSFLAHCSTPLPVLQCCRYSRVIYIYWICIFIFIIVTSHLIFVW